MNIFWQLISAIHSLAQEVAKHRAAVNAHTQSAQELGTAVEHLAVANEKVASAIELLAAPPATVNPAFAKITIGLRVPE